MKAARSIKKNNSEWYVDWSRITTFQIKLQVNFLTDVTNTGWNERLSFHTFADIVLFNERFIFVQLSESGSESDSKL